MYSIASLESKCMEEVLIRESCQGSAGVIPVEFAEWFELQHIIAERLINPVFQPIISLSNSMVYGYESLSRIIGPGIIDNPEMLFEKASQFGMTVQLERLCREKALHRAVELELEGTIFLNVCPALLYAETHSRGFTAELLDRLGMARSRVVFELTEKSLINDYDLFVKGVSHYRSQGYRIAIDDLGDGYAGLKMLSQITPDYVKLARFLVCDIDRQPAKQALVEAITCFSKRIGAMVIAEGIETKEELAYLSGITVDYGQGYFLSRPASVPPSKVSFTMPEYVPDAPRCDQNRLCRYLSRR